MQSSSLTSRHLLASLVVALSLTPVIAFGQAGTDNKGAQTTSGTTVTHNEPPAAGDDWTPGKMHDAKPFPMPSIKGSPVPQQVTPSPYTEPSGSSSPGFGGPAPR